jgi:hypothetical protein
MLLPTWVMLIKNETGNDSIERNNGKMREQTCRGKQVYYKGS